MPTYDAGTSGLTGTIGVTIMTDAGAVHVARTTAGISEPVAGSGVYYIADHDTDATLTYVWDNGAGTVGASETLYAGRESVVKLLRNKTVTDPSDGTMTVYDDDGTTPLYTASIYEDASSATAYRNTGINTRDRLE